MHGMKQSSHDKHSFAEMREGMGHGKRVLESFRSDTFDATSAAPPAENCGREAPHHGKRRRGNAVRALSDHRKARVL